MNTITLSNETNVSFDYEVLATDPLANGFGVAVAVKATMRIEGHFETHTIERVFGIMYQTIPAKSLAASRGAYAGVEVAAMNTLSVSLYIQARPYQVWQAKTASIPSSLNEALYDAFEALMNYNEKASC